MIEKFKTKVVEAKTIVLQEMPYEEVQSEISIPTGYVCDALYSDIDLSRVVLGLINKRIKDEMIFEDENNQVIINVNKNKTVSIERIPKSFIIPIKPANEIVSITKEDFEAGMKSITSEYDLNFSLSDEEYGENLKQLCRALDEIEEAFMLPIAMAMVDRFEKDEPDSNILEFIGYEEEDEYDEYDEYECYDGYDDEYDEYDDYYGNDDAYYENYEDEYYDEYYGGYGEDDEDEDESEDKLYSKEINMEDEVKENYLHSLNNLVNGKNNKKSDDNIGSMFKRN